MINRGICKSGFFVLLWDLIGKIKSQTRKENLVCGHALNAIDQIFNFSTAEKEKVVGLVWLLTYPLHSHVTRNCSIHLGYLSLILF